MALKIVVVGGVAGGMSAATRARRMNESASIIVLERGRHVSFANCGLPYYLAGRIKTEDKLLVTTAAKVRERFNIDARIGHEVTRIDRNRKSVEGIDHVTGQGFSLPYDKLILAPGAEAIIPPIEHIHSPNVFLLRSMEDTQAIHRWLGTGAGRSAVIVGAGFIGLEMAEAMRDRGMDVTVVEKASHPLPLLDRDMAGWIGKELASHGVKLVTGSGLKALQADKGTVTHGEIENGQILPADLVVLSIGVRPSVKLAVEAGLVIGPSGGIAVDGYQRTSDPEIYAAGDAAEVIHGVTGRPMRIPLAGPANRQGRVAGEHAASGVASPAGKVLGTAIVQVFGLAVGMTGLSENAARAAGFDVDAAYVHPSHHAGYYPDARPLHIKLVYDRSNGRILGAQIAGSEGVDKRLDVIATAMHFGGSIDDLAALDLAYAPQFGSAKDPIHMAAFVAQNQQRRLMPAVTAQARDAGFLLDVRTSTEFAGGSLPGAVNIPVDELRQRLAELDRNQPITIMCQVGMRGYIAQRILQQNGFAQVWNIKGGYTSASAAR